MISAELKKLCAFIKTNNTYFDKGFYDVYRDPVNGSIQDGEEEIFPNDTIGNYFYLRYDGVPSGINVPSSFLEEGRFGGAMRVPVVLVAYMRDADESQLFLNLINTLRSYKTTDLSFGSFIYNTNDAVFNELRGLSDKEAIQAAIKRIPFAAKVVAISFSIFKELDDFNLNCIKNPCPKC